MTQLLAPLLSWLGGNRPIPEEQNSLPPGTLAGTRFYLRHQVRRPVMVFWKDPEGINRSARTQSLDISELGVLVESSEPIPPGSSVFVNAKSIEVMASALVRHCSQRGAKFRVGLEFHSPVAKDFSQLQTGFRVRVPWKRKVK